MQEGFGTEILVPIIVTTSKISILLFYREIFVSQTFRRFNNALAAICLAWFLAIFFLILFRCTPISGAWTYSGYSSGDCVPISTIVLGMETTNICIDVLIMILPCWELRKLQMRRSRKILVSFVFALGGL